jgi:hypothetical protein
MPHVSTDKKTRLGGLTAQPQIQARPCLESRPRAARKFKLQIDLLQLAELKLITGETNLTECDKYILTSDD